MTIERLLPTLQVDDARDAIAFYQRVFGAVEAYRVIADSGAIALAELTIGSASVVVSDSDPGLRSAATTLLYVDAIDGWARRLIAEGAEPFTPEPATIPGRRRRLVVDPFGQRWLLEQPLDAGTPRDLNLPLDEIRERDA